MRSTLNRAPHELEGLGLPRVEGEHIVVRKPVNPCLRRTREETEALDRSG